jgi:hypothetical protein
MSEPFGNTAEQMAAFQKIWSESMGKVMQAAFAGGQDSPPPELLKQIRAGMFQALAQSWDEFMRSPQFLEAMKQWMDNAIRFRQMSKDFMANIRNELQAPSREDLDSIMLTVRHMERQVLDRIDGLARELGELKSKRAGKTKPAARNGSTRRAPEQKRRRASKAAAAT